jgi:hypothetical protein
MVNKQLAVAASGEGILLARQPPCADNPGMKALRLTLSLAVCVPVMALLGAAAADTYFPAWAGALVGGGVGLFLRAAFGGTLPRSVADYCFGPEAPDGDGPWRGASAQGAERNSGSTESHSEGVVK